MEFTVGKRDAQRAVEIVRRAPRTRSGSTMWR